MRSPISFRRVLRALPEIGVAALIALGIGMTVIALLFAVAEVVA